MSREGPLDNNLHLTQKKWSSQHFKGNVNHTNIMEEKNILTSAAVCHWGRKPEDVKVKKATAIEIID